MSSFFKSVQKFGQHSFLLSVQRGSTFKFETFVLESLRIIFSNFLNDIFEKLLFVAVIQRLVHFCVFLQGFRCPYVVLIKLLSIAKTPEHFWKTILWHWTSTDCCLNIQFQLLRIAYYHTIIAFFKDSGLSMTAAYKSATLIFIFVASVVLYLANENMSIDKR